MCRKILQVITLSERGGAQRHVADLTASLIKRGYEVHVASAPGGPLLDEAVAAGAFVHPLPTLVRHIDPVKDLVALMKICALIRRLKPDVVHAHSSKAGVLARVSARLCGVPSVYTAHGLVFLEPLSRARALAYLAMERIGGACGTRLIAVSRRDAEAAVRARLAPSDRITIVPNGYDPPGPPKLPPAAPPFRIATIANCYPTKGLDVLIEALGDPRLRDLPIEILVAGDGPERRRLEESARGLPVRFLGRVDQVEELLAGVHATVQPSRKEGWPYAVLEAMGAARPVIATDVGGVADQLDRDRSGWIVPPSDPRSLATSLAAAVADPEEASRRGAAGYARVLSEFSVESMVDGIEREYIRAIAERTSRR